VTAPGHALRGTLNYNHLRYFWTVARLGSVTDASRALNLTQPTVSAQLRQFERAVGAPLFERRGREQRLTEAGRVLLRFAEEVFTLEREVHDTFAGLPTGRAGHVRIGVADGVPKLLAYRLLAPVLALESPPKVVVREGTQGSLLDALADHRLDLVLLDAPPSGRVATRAHSHELGESGLTIFAAPALARALRGRFPRSLAGAPFLMPAQGTVVRQLLETWLAGAQLRPRIVAELEDSALLKLVGLHGHGLFALPTVVREDVRGRYGARALGEVPGARVRFYAITMERRLPGGAAGLVADVARRVLLA